VGKAARAAAREDDAERAAGQPARHPGDAVREPAASGHDVVCARRDGVEQWGDLDLRNADEDELRVGHRVPLTAGARDDEHAIRLAAAETGPGGVRAGVHEQDVAVALLRCVHRRREPVTLEAAAVEHLHGAPAAEGPRELSCEPGRVVADHGQHRDTRRRQLEPAARLELAGELAGERRGEGRVAVELRREPLGVDLHEPRVAERADRRGPGRPGEHAELAQRRTGAEHAHDPGPVFLVHHDL
jgi:hypothetical protein